MSFNGVAFDGVFDAGQYEPIATVSKPVVPEGWYFAQVTDTSIKPTAKADSGYLQFDLDLSHCETGATGATPHRFNLWNTNLMTSEIAHKQLSGVCHATGIHKINLAHAGREMIGARYRVKVIVKKQKSTRVGAGENDTFDTNEIQSFTDMQGNIPGKGQPSSASVPTGGQPAYTPPAAPSTAPQQSWGGQPASQPQPSAPAPQQWGNSAAGQPPAAPAWGGASTPAPSAPPANMPWGNRG